jgi:cytochrome P450
VIAVHTTPERQGDDVEALEVRDYDPFAPDTLEDPHPAHRWLVEQCPVHFYEPMGFYTVSRHEHLLEVARDQTRFTAHFGQGPVDRAGGGMLDDPPDHTMFRRMVLSFFTPRRIEAQTPLIEQLADELIGTIEARQSRTAELHDDVACPLPVIVIARLLGVAEEDRERFKVWSDAQVAAMGRADRSNRETQAQMYAYLQDGVTRRRCMLADGDALPDDLISGLVTAAASAPREITDAEILGMLGQLLVGGNETTTSLITNCVWRLLEDRERWEATVADPSLAEVAVEESLRFDPPVLGLWRKAVCPVTWNGVTIPEGARVQMLYAAANRDPAAFDDPNSFRLDRDLAELRRTHVSFGSGVHFCLGASMARTEAIVAVRTLAARLPSLRLAGPTERIEPQFLWGRHRLPVAW